MASIQCESSKKQTEPTAVSHEEINNTSRLLDLPAEIRNKIYRYAVVSNESIEMKCQSAGPDHYRFAMMPALSEVSKQVRRETQRMFLEENEFKVTIQILRPRDPKFLLAFNAMHQRLGLELRGIHVSYESTTVCEGMSFRMGAILTLRTIEGRIRITNQEYSEKFIGRRSRNWHPSFKPGLNVCGCRVMKLLHQSNVRQDIRDLVLFLQRLSWQPGGLWKYHGETVNRNRAMDFSGSLCQSCSTRDSPFVVF